MDSQWTFIPTRFPFPEPQEQVAGRTARKHKGEERSIMSPDQTNHCGWKGFISHTTCRRKQPQKWAHPAFFHTLVQVGERITHYLHWAPSSCGSPTPYHPTIEELTTQISRRLAHFPPPISRAGGEPRPQYRPKATNQLRDLFQRGQFSPRAEWPASYVLLVSSS